MSNRIMINDETLIHLVDGLDCYLDVAGEYDDDGVATDDQTILLDLLLKRLKMRLRQ